MKKVIILIAASLFAVSCSNVAAGNAETVDIKVVNKDLRNAERALQAGDIDRVLATTKKHAYSGNAKAQYMYGHSLYLKFYMENYGKTITESLKRQEARVEEETLKWMTKSANQGYAGGQSYLGGYFMEGDDAKNRQPDYVLGLMWTILAESQRSEKDSVESAIEELRYNFKVSDEEIKKAKTLARAWHVAK